MLYSHRSIVLHTLVLLAADSFAISERDMVMPIVPMFHVNARGLPYAAAMAGADLVLPGPRMSPDALASQLAGHRVTFWGERPRACLVLAPGRVLTAEDLRAHLAGRVASWWVPDEFRFVAEIPKTATGKSAKAALRRLAVHTGQ